MALAKIVGGFFGLWVLFYFVIYLSYMSPDEPGSEIAADVIIKDTNILTRELDAKIADTPFAKHDEDVEHKKHHSFAVKTEYIDYFEPAISTNPFVSPVCAFRTQQARELLSSGAASTRRSVGVIIPVRNEKKNEVLKTVESIIKNSGNELKKITIVDDFSAEPVALWPEWDIYLKGANDRFGGEKGDVLEIKRMQNRNGVAKAKAFGAEHLRMEKVDILVFLDAHVLVSKDWLIPLTTQLTKHTESIVYPVSDIIDGSTGDLIKSANAIGAFDWALNFRWEILPAEQDVTMKSRLPISSSDKDGHPIGEDDVVTTPAAPGMLAINAKYYHDIGGFDTTLYPWGQENIELSIRVWLCGGVVIRQPCSRVAHTYRHLFEDAKVNNGVTQEQIDRNVMSVAELWLSPPQRETVYQARFTNRIPYTVETSLDARSLKEFLGVKVMREEKCQSFDWYISEIYPGLELDRENVEIGFKNHLSSKYLETALSPMVEQYGRESSIHTDPEEVALLTKRANTVDELALKSLRAKAIPAVVVKIVLTPRERHQDLIRDTLQCVDLPKTLVTDKHTPCEQLLQQSPDACVSQRVDMMFLCPHTCSMCGTDGKICFDFYEHKCPIWKAEGQCETQSSVMESSCRLTCGFCTKEAPRSVAVEVVEQEEDPEIPLLPDEEPEEVPVKVIEKTEEKAVEEEQVMVDHNIKPVVIESVVTAEEAQAVAALALITQSRVANPFKALEQYKSGLLPDPPVGDEGACGLNDKSDGNLLSYMSLAVIDEKAPGPKILCGIYTMAKNHDTNVKATRETWGKRCDGFVAYSTVTDDNISAIEILHEGDEHYQNMWQKSRSIWKYIHAHYADTFDYFLLGGDDMFYIIENLRDYLASEEIVKYTAENDGIFLGRRFWSGDTKLFNSGGAGYILDRKALNVLATHLDSPSCYPHQRGFWEDVNVANCLKVAGNIEPYDTRDKLDRERFNPFTPGTHLDYRIPKKEGDWYPKYNPYLKEGYDCCSPGSVSFHYCGAELVRKLYNFFYNCKDKHKHK